MTAAGSIFSISAIAPRFMTSGYGSAPSSTEKSGPMSRPSLMPDSVPPNWPSFTVPKRVTSWPPGRGSVRKTKPSYSYTVSGSRPSYTRTSKPSCTTASSSATVVSSMKGDGIASLVDTTGEVLVDPGPDQLVQRETVAAGGLERAARPVRDLEGSHRRPPAAPELGERGIEVVAAVDENRPLAVEVAGEQYVGTVAEPDPGHHRSHPPNPEDQLAAEDVRVVGLVLDHVGARDVEEVQAREHP